jgi:hypothetical protein
MDEERSVALDVPKYTEGAKMVEDAGRGGRIAGKCGVVQRCHHSGRKRTASSKGVTASRTFEARRQPHDADAIDVRGKRSHGVGRPFG